MLDDGKPGHTTQSIGLAEALGWPYEIKKLAFTPLAGFGPVLRSRLGATVVRVDRNATDGLAAPLPGLPSPAGLRPDRDIPDEHTGVRDGGTRHEELFHPGETPAPTGREGVLLALSPATDLDKLRRQITQLAAAAEARRGAETFALLHSILPGYAPMEESAQVGAAQ